MRARRSSGPRAARACRTRGRRRRRSAPPPRAAAGRRPARTAGAPGAPPGPARRSPARCTSCPHACMASFADAQRRGRPLRDRQRVELGADGDGGPGRPDPQHDARCLRPARHLRRSPPRRRSAVRCSAPETSGDACSRCRSSTASGSSAGRAASHAVTSGAGSRGSRGRPPGRCAPAPSCPAAATDLLLSACPACPRSRPLVGPPRAPLVPSRSTGLTPARPESRTRGGRCRRRRARRCAGVGGRPLPRRDALVEDLPERRPEPGRAEVVQLREPVGVGGVQQLGERSDLHRLGEDRRAARPAHVVQVEPDVVVDVRVDAGEVPGLPVVRPGVQQHHRHAVQVQPVREQAGVDPVHPDVGVAVPDVELDRAARGRPRSTARAGRGRDRPGAIGRSPGRAPASAPPTSSTSARAGRRGSQSSPQR